MLCTVHFAHYCQKSVMDIFQRCSCLCPVLQSHIFNYWSNAPFDEVLSSNQSSEHLSNRIQVLHPTGPFLVTVPSFWQTQNLSIAFFSSLLNNSVATGLILLLLFKFSEAFWHLFLLPQTVCVNDSCHFPWHNRRLISLSVFWLNPPFKTYFLTSGFLAQISYIYLFGARLLF